MDHVNISRSTFYAWRKIAHVHRRQWPRAVYEHIHHLRQRYPNLEPDKVQVLTDNGSEFLGQFDQYVQQQGWRHCHTHPRCPKMNAYTERFSRTIRRVSSITTRIYCSSIWLFLAEN